jgi:hypothetical protein
MLLYLLRSSSKPGLANINPFGGRGHTIHKGLPEGHTCVYTYLKGGGIELTRMLVFTYTTFVVLLFIIVAILCSVDLLYSVKLCY